MRISLLWMMAGLLLAACGAQTDNRASEAGPASGAKQGGKAFVTGSRLLRSEKAFPGRYIVVLEDKAARQGPPQRLASELATLHGAAVERVYTSALQGFVATMPEASARRLSLDPRVRYVEEDGVVTLQGVQEGAGWNLDRIDQRAMPLDQSYIYNRTGNGVNVYVIDSGIRTTHLDLRWRASYGFYTVYDGHGSSDCNGHGTHVAGIIGGSTHGVAKGVKLYSVRVLDCGGAGYYSDVIAGVDWVTANHVKPAVANMSLRAAVSQSLDDAVTRSIHAGITYVVSAGNGGGDACYSSPARTPAALTVGATDTWDARASFSNLGGCVDLFAPGVDITSAWIGADGATRVNSGTSMATAHVTGAAALYLEGNPTATPEQVASALLGSATPDKVSNPGAGSPNRLLYSGCAGGNDSSPPQVVLTGPSAGAALSGTVTLTASATDDLGVVKVEFFHGTHLLGTDTSPPYELVWDSATASNGPGLLTARAYDGSCWQGTSAPVEVTIHNDGNATFDSRWQVPACVFVGNRCDSVFLLDGRAGIGPELHAPNTLGSTCADGTVGTYRSSASLDRLAVIRSDGGAFAAGKEVTVEATVWANGNYWNEYLDLYSAADASNPTWTFLTTLRPTRSGAQVLSGTYLLPAGGMQALRGVYRTQGSAQACNTGSLNDHDDLVFAVGEETDSSAPTVAIASPASGATVEELVTIGVAASDNFGVARVEVYDGTTLLGTDTAPPFSLVWNTKGAPNGPHTLTARAYDAAGFSATSAPVELILNNDITPPQVALTSHTEGESVSGMVKLQASASDDREVSYVEFFRRTSWGTTYNLGSTSVVPYSLYWDSKSAYNGSYTFFVKAYDRVGNASTSSPVTLVVDNDYTPPTTAITSPAAGAALSGTVFIEASATDNRKMSSVYFYVDGHFVGYSATAPYSVAWDTAIETNGSHEVWSTAYDSAGNSATSARVTVSVSNPGSAAYDPVLKAPGCATVGDHCDSGRLLWRKGPYGPEPHQPNTLDGCLDGTWGSHPYTPYIDRIRLSRADGTVMASGKRVRLDVDVWSYRPEYEALDLYYTSDATQPSWTYLTTLKPGGSSARTLSVEYVLPAGSLQAVRANFRTSTTPRGPSPCSAGDENDHDDLVFAVSQEPDTTPPSTVLTSPAGGAVLSGVATATATASDDYEVASVEFYDGTTLLGTDASPPYSVSWNTWNTPNGSHSLTAVARDAAGHAGSSSPVIVTVDNDHASLATSITAPTEGATLMGTVTISASAANPSKVAKVQFYAGTRLLGTDLTSPYSVSWDVLNEPAGEYILTTRTYDAAGNMEPSAPVRVTVERDTSPPQVVISKVEPGTETTVWGRVGVYATATDNTQLSRIELYVDGVLTGSSSATSTPYLVGWDTRTVENGSHTLMLKAYDIYGNVGISPEQVRTVANDITPPTVFLTYPTDGSTVNETVTVKADAFDDRFMDKVELYFNGKLLGVSYSSAPTFSWATRNGANGTYTLLAKAYDAAGNMSSSPLVTVTVDNDYTAPAVALTSPAPGAAVAGMVSLQADASDNRGVTKVEFFVDGARVASVSSPPFVVNWDSHAVYNGSHTLTAKAYDAAGYSTTSAPVTVTVAQPGAAVYDAARRVPVCAEVSSVCDSTALVRGRGTVGPEPHQPNTLDGCTDGMGGSSRPEQIHWLKVSRADGAPLDAGRRVRLDVGVEIGGTPSSDYIDIYSASDANAPSWTYLTTLQAGVSGPRVLSTEYVLPVGSLQAVRAHFRYGGSSPSPCGTGYYDDHDDLVFAVGPLADVTPPTVALTSPVRDAQVGGTVTVTAAADDDYSVTKVEFYVGQTLLGSDTTAPYGVSWNSAWVADGAYTLTAKAYDIAGLVSTTEALPVIVDNTLPTVSFTSPSKTYVQGVVQVEATASDNREVVRVEFSDGSGLIGTDTTAPYSVSWNTTGLPNGYRTLTAKAYDAAGNVRGATRSVYVDTVAPTVAITSPQNGGTVLLNTTIQASASDNSNIVTQVVFYDGNTVIGTDTTAPYSVSWNTTLVSRGQHTLTARAHDQAGNVTTSAPVVVTVQ